MWRDWSGFLGNYFETVLAFCSTMHHFDSFPLFLEKFFVENYSLTPEAAIKIKCTEMPEVIQSAGMSPEQKKTSLRRKDVLMRQLLNSIL